MRRRKKIQNLLEALSDRDDENTDTDEEVEDSFKKEFIVTLSIINLLKVKFSSNSVLIYVSCV